MPSGPNVKSDPRFRSFRVLALALALGACNPASHGTSDNDGGGDDTSPATRDANDPEMPDAHDATGAKHRDAGADASSMLRDASPRDASPMDAGSSPGSDARSPGGTVGCYADVDPAAVCTLPIHCCFTNYSSQHNGSCTTDACVWGTIACDGPEDGAAGQHCCAHAIMDDDYTTVGYTLACQASACGPAPVNQEMCHRSAAATCPTGKTCVTTFGNDNDLPRELDICK
jgi:hypothetical protein